MRSALSPARPQLPLPLGHPGLLALLLTLGACSAPVPRDAGRGHLQREEVPATPRASIPPPVRQSLPPPPVAQARSETYSVVVNNLPAHELLFALARDAKLNVDIHPGIQGRVTLNALDQTLPQLLQRIAQQIDMRFELKGKNLAVMPDTPYLHHYHVDYVNLARKVNATVATNTQIATSGGGAANAAANTSNTRIENSSQNQFWESLEKNLQDLLRETDKLLPEGSSETVVEQNSNQNASGVAALPAATSAKAAGNLAGALAANPTPTASAQSSGSTLVRRTTYREAASVIVNPESGTVSVRATGRQHEKVQEFIDRVINAARRQVMIETTIVEVTLDDGYEQGINWSKLIAGGGDNKFTLALPSLGSTGVANLTYKDGKIDTALRLLESFGTTKVLSSPRVSVLNNQTALLKVVENIVYFNVKADTVTTANVGTTTTYTTTPQTVSVGLVLTVTPQISDNDSVILNVRPTITSVGDFIDDPNPSLLVKNRVPQINTREIESVMRVGSGSIAVLGGLMRDNVDYQTARIPVLGRVPLLGEAFTNRNNSARKSELVIFLRPVVIKDASLGGDYAALRDSLPGRDFFTPPREASPIASPSGEREAP